jgi:mono/diheme cytochrome c family protein
MRKPSNGLTLAAIFCLSLGVLLILPASQALAGHGSSHLLDAVPQPTPDILDVPVMPENPTEVQVGEVVYYYNCMPCHGDHGQGLTDEFRQIWVEDHQNCWAVGCHGGRVSDEGFPIPKYVPAVSARPDQLMRFASPENLFDYLQSYHPPQRPGALEDEEYWAVTALLLFENQRLESDGRVGLQQANLPQIKPLTGIILFLATSLLVASLLIWQSKSTDHSVPPRKE